MQRLRKKQKKMLLNIDTIHIVVEIYQPQSTSSPGVAE